MIVDDELFNINALLIILQYGVKIDIDICVTASSGKQAIQYIK